MTYYILLMLLSATCGTAGTVISKVVQRQQGTVSMATSMFIIVECGLFGTAFMLESICGAFASYLNMTCSANLPASAMAVFSTGFSLVMTTLMAWLFFKEKPTWMIAGSMAVTIAAIALLS